MKKQIVLCLVVLMFVSVTGCYAVKDGPPSAGYVGDAPAEPVEGEWVPIKISARGAGAPPANAINQAQARLMTERAAKVDAMRNLVEQAYGVTIRSRTIVQDFVTQSDKIRARVDAFLKGAQVIDTKYNQDGSVEVEMEIILDYEFRRIFP